MLLKITNWLRSSALLYGSVGRQDHHAASSLSTCQSNGAGSDRRKARKLNGALIKLLIDKEMSKEKDSNKHNPPNVVAKLMGLETLSRVEKPNVERSIIKDFSSQHWKMEDSYFMDKEMLHEVSTYKDIYESEDIDGTKMALIQQKFMEAKIMSTDERLRESKQFEDVLEVLSSNSDLLVRLLDSQNLYGLHSTSLAETTKQITLIKPIKMVDNEKSSRKGKKKKNDRVIKKSPANVDQEGQKRFEFPIQSTRIVVLKPSPGRTHDITKALVSPTTSSPRNLMSRNFYQGLEDFTSSVFSKGYIGDESSFNKSYHDYSAENFSDLEAMSQCPRNSFDYIIGYGSPYSTLSVDRLSCSPESSVNIEAKKRLSERWSTNKAHQEQRNVRRNSTLGEMLSLSHVKKKSLTCEIESIYNEDKEVSKVVSFSHSFNNEEIRFGDSPKDLPRSNSVPTSSTVYENGLGLEEIYHDAGKSHGSKGVKKSKSLRSSFKGKVASLFFSRNKKSTKGKSSSFQSKDEFQSNVTEISHGSFMDDESESFSIGGFEECSLSLYETSGNGSSSDQHGIITLEPGMSLPKPLVPLPQISSENQDQPSPISVLEPSFEDRHEFLDTFKGSHVSLKSNLIDKSPPIESIARTLSWDDSGAEVSSSYPLKPLMVSSLDTNVEEQEWLILVQKLLLAAGLEDQELNESFYTRWYSLESPLDPSLRDTYANVNNEKGPQGLNEGRRRKMRSNQKFVFDFVNGELKEIVGYGIEKGFKSNSRMKSGVQVQKGKLTYPIFLMDHIVAQMKKLMASGVKEDCGDSTSLVVENVVRKEVVGIGWVELMELEIDILGREIEGDLIQELVEHVVVDFMGRA